MPSILICEPHCEGHHTQYLRWITRGFLERGYNVCLATSTGCLDHPGYLALQKEFDEKIETLSLPQNKEKPEEAGSLSLVRLELRYHKMFADCYRHVSRMQQPEYVFVPYLDYCLYATSLLGSPFGRTPWGGIIMRPAFHMEAMGIMGPESRLQSVKRSLFLHLLRRDRSLRTLFTIDETLMDYVRRSEPELARRLRYLPDPVALRGSHSRESARRMLRIPDNTITVLVYGTLNGRKGVDALLASMSEGGLHPKLRVLLAGVQDTGVNELLASPRGRALRKAGRIYEMNRFLSGEEEHAVFRAADIAWLGYRGHYGQSAVLVQAAMMGLPIVACDEGLIGWQVREHGLGLTVTISDTRAVSEALSRLAHDRRFSASCGENGKGFSTSHGLDNFSRIIGEEIPICSSGDSFEKTVSLLEGA